MVCNHSKETLPSSQTPVIDCKGPLKLVASLIAGQAASEVGLIAFRVRRIETRRTGFTKMPEALKLETFEGIRKDESRAAGPIYYIP